MRSTRPSEIRHAVIGAAVALMFADIGAAVAAPDCRAMAAHLLDAFFNRPMESTTTDDDSRNPCTGRGETAVIEFKPGDGDVRIFPGGDQQGEVDDYFVILCADGRALVRDRDKSKRLCDTLN